MKDPLRNAHNSTLVARTTTDFCTDDRVTSFPGAIRAELDIDLLQLIPNTVEGERVGRRRLK